MKKDFDTWNNIKKEVENRVFPGDDFPFPKKREVWMCVLGKNIGFEQNGGGDNFSRPVLVIKKFNNQMFWVAPLSTKQKEYDFYYNFTDPENLKVSLILAQLRLVSIKRFGRPMYEFSSKDFNTIISRLKDLLS